MFSQIQQSQSNQQPQTFDDLSEAERKLAERIEESRLDAIRKCEGYWIPWGW